ncbi:hypothetical protein V9K67_03220 [Paraflavisolibacter sp. H34]|uniref:cell division protein FtsQ/DivIB n=1 Tax=Huijunlia imazamoxiresistens TaxID=3127457 RepID=UPI0030163161
MKKGISIKKVVQAGLWFTIASGILTLLVAANSGRNSHFCKKVVINIRGEGEDMYLDKSDIAGALKFANNGRLIDKPVASIDLAMLEKELEKNPWIAQAELFFDHRDVLQVALTERLPVARVFTTTGKSFYLDSGGVRMPLLPGMSARVPVVSNFPAVRKLSSKDSALLNEVKQVATFVNEHPFWRAQIAQVDITPARTFELLPTIGNHVIRIGTAENLDQKLKRLFLFYQQVASKSGFDRYGALDVQFEGQVVAVHKGEVSVVDSLKLQENIRELLRRSALTQDEEEAEESEAAAQQAEAEATPARRTETPGPQSPPAQREQDEDRNTAAEKKPAPEKKTTEVKKKPSEKPVRNKPAVKKQPEHKTADRKPKAVMPRRQESER